MDEVEIDRGPAGTIVRMRRKITAGGRGLLMRDRIAGFEFEQRDDVLIAAGRGRDRQLERGRAAAGAVRAAAERLERPGPRPQQRDLPGQLRDPPAVRPRPPARRAPPGAAAGGARLGADAPGARALCRRRGGADGPRARRLAAGALRDLGPGAGAASGDPRAAGPGRLEALHRRSSRRPSVAAAGETTSPTRFGERLQQQHLAAADGPADPGRESDHADQPAVADHRRRDQRPAPASRRPEPPGRAGRGARAPRAPARPRRARPARAASRPSASGSEAVTRTSPSPSSSAR